MYANLITNMTTHIYFTCTYAVRHLKRHRQIDFIIDILYESMKGAELVSSGVEKRGCFKELSKRLEEVERKFLVPEKFKRT